MLTASLLHIFQRSSLSFRDMYLENYLTTGWGHVLAGALSMSSEDKRVPLTESQCSCFKTTKLPKLEADQICFFKLRMFLVGNHGFFVHFQMTSPAARNKKLTARLRELDLTDNHLGPKAVAKVPEMGWVWFFIWGGYTVPNPKMSSDHFTLVGCFVLRIILPTYMGIVWDCNMPM